MSERGGNPDRLVPIVQHLSSVEADLIRCHLEEVHLQSFVGNASLVGMDWALANAIGGAQVLVRQSDADAALAHLRRRGEAPSTSFAGPCEEEDFGDSSEADAAELQPERSLSISEEQADRAFRAAILGLILFPLQAYVAWLLFHVTTSGEPMRPLYARRAWIAFLLWLPFAAAVLLFIWELSRSP